MLRKPHDLEATSLLTLGAKGRFEGEPFTLAGRRCVQGERGQVWNEWSLRFEHERPALTLSESAGTFTLYREGSILPRFEELAVGMEVAPPWVVVEKGRAARLATWGEPGEEAAPEYDYVDLSFQGTPARRATIAEGQTFVGEPMAAETLGLSLRDALPALVPAPNVSPPSGVDPCLEVGDTGELDGVAYRVLGIIVRHVSTAHATHQDDEEAPAPVHAQWEEYLLYNARVGLRWLSVGDGHWTYASPLEAGDAAPTLAEVARTRTQYIGNVVWAGGELPWSVDIGEQAVLIEDGDLAIENTFRDIGWSRIREVPPDSVARAFSKRTLPRPR